MLNTQFFRNIFILGYVLTSLNLSAAPSQENIPIKSWTMKLEGGEIPKGLIFEEKFGTLQCGAGYIYAIQSRNYTNSNDLEFWCRSKEIKLNFEKLPQSHKGLNASIANIKGDLYEFQSAKVFDFMQQKWTSSHPFTKIPKPYLIQTKSNIIYTFTSQKKNCPGLSLFANNDYLGTIKTNNFSAAAIWNNKFYVNCGNTVYGDIPSQASNTCKYLNTNTLTPKQAWSYGIYMLPKGEIIMGGNQGGYGKSSLTCTPFLTLFNDSYAKDIVGTLNQKGCTLGTIKEYYSYSPFKKGVLIGNFPIGTLLYYDGTKTNFTNIAQPTTEDWQDPKGTYYRESQAIVNAYGTTFVGMYPWGEVIFYDHVFNKENKVRVFDMPLKSKVPTPYFWEIQNRVKKNNNVQFNSNSELVYSLTKNGQSLRDEGLEPTRWGQRIPSITMFSGRICVSTCNLSGDSYDKEKHPEITKEVLDQYGRVYCASLPNHLLIPEPQGRTAQFIITDKFLKIEIDGKLVGKNEHNLSKHELDLLRGK